MRAAVDDSDDDAAPVQKVVTKAKAVKAEDRKEAQANNNPKQPKVNAKKMQEGGFENFVDNSRKQREDRPQTAGGNRGGDRGGRGRGGRGGDRGGRGGRPQTGNIKNVTDAEGNPVKHRDGNTNRPYRGKPREDAHPNDR